jgi:hypothetical protein
LAPGSSTLSWLVEAASGGTDDECRLVELDGVCAPSAARTFGELPPKSTSTVTSASSGNAYARQP